MMYGITELALVLLIYGVVFFHVLLYLAVKQAVAAGMRDAAGKVMIR